MEARLTAKILFLVLAVFFLSRCILEPLTVIDYWYDIHVKLDIVNESAQGQEIVFHGVQESYTKPGIWGTTFYSDGREMHEVSCTVPEGNTITLDGKSGGVMAGRFSFYVEIGGECYLGWSKLESLHDKYGEEMKLSIAKDNLGVATISQQGEGVRTEWEGLTPSTTSSPSDKAWPTARYTVTITDDGPDGTPRAEFTLTELAY